MKENETDVFCLLDDETKEDLSACFYHTHCMLMMVDTDFHHADCVLMMVNTGFYNTNFMLMMVDTDFHC